MSSAHRNCYAAFALIAAIAFAAPLSAQHVPAGDQLLWSVAPVGAPSAVEFAPAVSLFPVPATEAVEARALAPVPAMARSQSMAMMIVGGAAMIVGSLIDGDTGTIIMAGGGVVGLIGLFNYVR